MGGANLGLEVVSVMVPPRANVSRERNGAPSVAPDWQSCWVTRPIQVPPGRFASDPQFSDWASCAGCEQPPAQARKYQHRKGIQRFRSHGSDYKTRVPAQPAKSKTEILPPGHPARAALGSRAAVPLPARCRQIESVPAGAPLRPTCHASCFLRWQVQGAMRFPR